ncbi:ROK family protein [Nonomuraea sp. FMUSA5-5]|uniref:ROK family protein n=1 Tax=Nonomuraea composti TaxID=2720023 RepID=A0ABX1BLK6_9ACTN|nr:ROK family protein [Nonomuraea sp. FMUSA5-5]
MDEEGAVLGVDVGGTQIKWVLWSPGAGVLGHGELRTPRSGPPAVLAAVAELIGDGKAGAAGVAVPGHLTDDLRAVRLLPNLPGPWEGLPFAAELESRTGVRVRLVNDARAFALAELTLGAARGRQDVLFVTMGTGIGGALALGGRVLRAGGDRVGELGHMICRPGGPACGCGSRGCLEAVAGGSALVTAVRAGGGRARTPEEVVREAGRSGGLERSVLETAGSALALVLGNVVAYSGVSAVVVGGGVAPAFAFMRPAVEAELAARVRLVGRVDLRLAELGSGAGALGAALAATTRAPHPTNGEI